MEPSFRADADPKQVGNVVHAPCPRCGAQLKFSAGTQQLSCEYCQHAEPIDFTRNRLQENRLDFQLRGHELPHAPTAEKQVFSCHNCGAQTTVGDDTPTITCAFCGSKNVNPDAHKTRLIEPAGVMPFFVPRERVQQQFKAWVGSYWLAPSSLKSGAALDNLHGLYMPYWTFDAQATSEWAGDAGYYYYVTVEGRDAKGNRVTRQEQRTRWEHHRGTHQAFYDDLLIMASSKLSMAEHHVAQASRYELQAVVDYDPRLLLGWEAEVYSIDLAASAHKVESIIGQREEEACSEELGGDTQRGLQVDTVLTEQTFKHLLLPLWICTYQYRGKLYRFLVNGQTGEVAGERPVSWVKVALLVLLAVLLLAAFAYWQSQPTRH
ncbi:hypothetical protein [Hymenobacter sp. CRA2]|uniref:hypothetical protein n=1 Tax=Hymenobacter sp. CRA2 TaxID=1955620 RepID=UPI00098FCD39|nr:hypothetical protein [Hymenobacter sp. CRA2]OON68909.1 hypothetical protein B0919_12135 [Hymenobacter sp. CRA2]